MPRRQTANRQTVKPEPVEEIKECCCSNVLTTVREKNLRVRIRSGPGVNHTHVDGKYLGDGEFEIDQIAEGPGSKTGWGHLANGSGWVALDFVEVQHQSK